MTGVKAALPKVAVFDNKLSLFVNGRKNIFEHLRDFKAQHPDQKIIWIHCASLGEFEQGRPIIEYFNSINGHCVLLTFFSPSGYEVRKNYDKAHLVSYLPLDTKKNANCFIDIIKPHLVLFVKYEFWPNYLSILKKNNTPTYLISGIFRENQIFFKWYGKWMNKSLKAFNHFFVQNEASKTLLSSISINNVTVSGDTRYDRVHEIIQQKNNLHYIEDFVTNKTCVVYGSTWKEDIDIISDTIQQLKHVKHIIAPHHIDEATLTYIKENNPFSSIVLFSEMEGKSLEDYDVFILDTIGVLTKVYSYADIAYVGGAFKTGLHNILEPAAYGIPVVIGPHYNKFIEAVSLVENGGVIAIHDKDVFKQVLCDLVDLENDLRIPMGKKNKAFIENNLGATKTIIQHLGI